MPKKITKKELEKLSLRERLEKLRELAEEDEKDLEKTKELIKKTERELIREESSTDTGPAPAPESIEQIAEEAPSAPAEQRVEEEAAKYESYTPDYTAMEKPEEPVQKIEDSKYESSSEEATKSTSIKSEKDIKKYSRG